MSIHVDDLREIGNNRGITVCLEVADEIETIEAELATLREQLFARTKERDGLHDELNRIAGMFGVTLSIGASQHYIYPLVQDRVQKLREQLAAREAEITLDDRRIARLEEVLTAIPECKDHGNTCIPHALEWIKAAIARQEGGAS